MNKKLYLFRNIIYLVAIILLMILRFISSTMTLGIGIMYLLSVVLLIINFIDYKKNYEINNDKIYNIIYLLSSVLIVIILIRSMFDTNIVTVKFIKNFQADMFYNMAFLKSNLIYINLLLISILTYRIVYSMPKITIQIDSKKVKNKSKK